MQFNSYVFILLFMPITLIAYYLSNKINYLFGKIVIILASIIFYTWSDRSTIGILGISLIVNFFFAKVIEKTKKWHRFFLFIPLLINVSLLLYFKYLNFTILNISIVMNKELELRDIILPVGISFFTFQQIAYIVSIYRKELEKTDVVDYLVYILYFPKILMGPLVEPADFIGQINDSYLKKLNWDNIAYGIKLFSFGLFKKLMLADVFALAVSWGYTNIETATAMDWVLVMLFYTMEIYFDFSGYSDMAVGVSLMLNILLPINFDSPYKALSVRDFWKRWHISLTKFFTKYVYIPLGGSKKGKIFTYINTIIIFLISGVWHGANWTFILWGIIYGILMVFDRVFEDFEKKIFEPVRWVMTFGVINVLWLLFRSDSITQWRGILKTIFSFQDTSISDGLINTFLIQETTFLKNILGLEYFVDNVRGFWMLIFILGAFGVCLIPQNNYKNMNKISFIYLVLASIAFVWGFISLCGESVFVYFNF